jgi:hypothetical protein
MKTYLLAFLQALEVALPCPPGAHHSITRNRYGSDETGWIDELELHVHIDGTVYTYFLDDADFTKSIGDFVAEIVAQK